MRKRKFRTGGFTLIEMLVVLGIIAIIVSFALPKFMKSIGKAKVTDALQSLASASAQAESICATGSFDAATGAPSTAIFGETPGGYAAGTVTGKCTGTTALVLTIASASGDLPKLCFKRVATGNWMYGASYVTGWTREDVPVPSTKFDTTISCP